MSGGTTEISQVVGEGETGAVLMLTLHGDVLCTLTDDVVELSDTGVF